MLYDISFSLIFLNQKNQILRTKKKTFLETFENEMRGEKCHSPIQSKWNRRKITEILLFLIPLEKKNENRMKEEKYSTNEFSLVIFKVL